METLLSCVEPVVVVTNVANSLFDTALLMLVYRRLNETSYGNSDETQKQAARFYMIYNMIYSLAPLLSTVPLGKLADRHGQKILVVVPLAGYLLGRSLLLFTEIFQLSISVMYGSAIINGLTGGFPAYWSGINAIAALRSVKEKRSVRLNMLSVTSGMAGLLGSIVSGHFFLVKVQNQDGLLLIIVCLSLYTISLLYSATIFRYPPVPPPSPPPEETPERRSRVGSKYSTEVILLFICYIVYDFSVTGGANVVSLFVLKPPLSWDSVWVGYGKAASYMMFLTSFLGVLIFSRWMSDTSLVLMGIISNTIGFATMAFVTWSPIYFVARALMMFSCIPLPTIRAQLSKEMDKGSYGSIFAWLQSIMALTDVIATVVFNTIYPATLDWYSGFTLLLASAVSLISIVPIVVFSFKEGREAIKEVAGLESAQTQETVECSERPVKL